MVVLADSLQRVAAHARQINTDTQLRRQLAQQQVEDRVPEDKQVRSDCGLSPGVFVLGWGC
jgi:hypothetical protein